MGNYKASAANKGSLNSCQLWPRQVAWLSFYLPGLIVPLWSVCNGSPLYQLGFLYPNKAMRKQTHENKGSKAKVILALRIKLTQNKLTSLCFQASTFVYWAIAWVPECVFLLYRCLPSSIGDMFQGINSGKHRQYWVHMHNHYLYTPMLKLNLYLRLSMMFSIANKNRINIIIYCNKGSLKLVSCLFLEFSETMDDFG